MTKKAPHKTGAAAALSEAAVADIQALWWNRGAQDADALAAQHPEVAQLERLERAIATLGTAALGTAAKVELGWALAADYDADHEDPLP